MLLKCYNVKRLVFVVALCGVYELEVQRFFRQLGGCVLALVLPYGGIYEVLVVALGLAFLGLVLRAEVAAACVGCGACAATCKNGSAMLFVAARVSSLAKLPQGRVEGARRAKAMVAKMDELGFGNCTNTGACQAECPKSISIAHIARLNREFLSAKFED
mgnify:CR=1 FL=1